MVATGEKSEQLDDECRRIWKKYPNLRTREELVITQKLLKKLQFLQSNFGNLKPFEMDQLCRNIQHESFPPKHRIFKQGDQGDKFYVVFTGSVAIDVKHQIAGRISSEVTVCELGRGEYFGERALHNKEPRAASATTLEETELITIASDDYNRILRESQEDFLNKIRGQTGLQMGKRFQSQKDRCREILHKPGDERNEQDLMELITCFRKMKFFSNLEDRQIKEVSRLVFLVLQPANSVIYEQGSYGEMFYVIFSGASEVKLKEIEHGQETIISRLGEGDGFGSVDYSCDGEKLRPNTVSTTVLTELLCMNSRDHFRLMKESHDEAAGRKLAFLSRIPHFSSMSNDHLQENLSPSLSSKKFPINATIYCQGDRANYTYIVLRGELSMFRKEIVESREINVLARRIGPLELFGEEASREGRFNQTIHRFSTVTSTTPIEILQLSRYNLYHCLHEDIRAIFAEQEKKLSSEMGIFKEKVKQTVIWNRYKTEYHKSIQFRLTQSERENFVDTRGCKLGDDRKHASAKEQMAKLSSKVARSIREVEVHRAYEDSLFVSTKETKVPTRGRKCILSIGEPNSSYFSNVSVVGSLDKGARCVNNGATLYLVPFNSFFILPLRSCEGRIVGPFQRLQKTVEIVANIRENFKNSVKISGNKGDLPQNVIELKCSLAIRANEEMQEGSCGRESVPHPQGQIKSCNEENTDCDEKEFAVVGILAENGVLDKMKDEGVLGVIAMIVLACVPSRFDALNIVKGARRMGEALGLCLRIIKTKEMIQFQNSEEWNAYE